jgi:serine/threonine-protein kinase
VSGLLSVTETQTGAAAFVASCGTIVETFDRSQDSGNVSWIVATDAGEYFAKSAGTTTEPAPGQPVPYFDHAGRVRLLRNAVAVAASCDHRSLARLRNVVETGDGPVLVYDRAPGELVGTPREHRADPASPYRRFAGLPAARHVPLVLELFDAHVALATAGWIACDLYDGCLIVDFSTDRLTLIDLDTYVRGPFVNTMGRMFGSDRYMAPEEYELGAAIDQRTTVFTLGRLALHLGSDTTDDPRRYVGGADLAAVLVRATSARPADRYPDVSTLAAAYADAAAGDAKARWRPPHPRASRR